MSFLASSQHGVLTGLNKGAFFGCISLANITFKNPMPITYDSTWFTGCDNLSKIYVPHDSLEAYKTAWTEVADKITAIAEMGDLTEYAKVSELETAIADCYPLTKKEDVKSYFGKAAGYDAEGNPTTYISGNGANNIPKYDENGYLAVESNRTIISAVPAAAVNGAGLKEWIDDNCVSKPFGSVSSTCGAVVGYTADGTKN